MTSKLAELGVEAEATAMADIEQSKAEQRAEDADDRLRQYRLIN